MSLHVRLPQASTLFLSAGPRAGKTRLLLRWSRECDSPSQYFSLTPEDADPPFFLRRFLKEWPEIQGRFEALRAKTQVSWGGVLGVAIAETQPDFCLLLDDLYLAEGTPLMPELLALFRQFPPAGTLIVASRHQLPEVKRNPLATWDADHPLWEEHPEVAELTSLPRSLLVKALVLRMVGEAAYSPDGWELVRRNIACSVNGVHQLRPCWQEAASLALSFQSIEGVWDGLADELRGFIQRHVGTEKEEDLPTILDRIPVEMRRRHPFFLLLDGQLLSETGKHEEARTYFLEAITHAQDPGLRLDLKIRLLAIATRLTDSEGIATLLPQLLAEESVASPLQRAGIIYEQGILHWTRGEMPDAIAAMKRVLTIPASGERQVLFRHFWALYSLCTMHMDLTRPAEALDYAERMVALALDQRIHRDLIEAIAARLTCRFFDEAVPVPHCLLVDIPNEGLKLATPAGLHRYLLNFGIRAFFIKDYPLALRYFRILLAHAQANHFERWAQITKYWQMKVHSQLGEVEKVKEIYQELDMSEPRSLFAIQYVWAHHLIEAGHLQEAEELLQALLPMFPEGTDRARILLYQYWIRFLRGDALVHGRIKELLESPEGSPLWDSEARLMEQLGLRKLPATFHLHAFGNLSFSQAGAPPARWPRRKALSLLALLALHPEGISADVLVDKLYENSETADPFGALHTLAYKLRQVLRTVGAEHLLASSPGMYRLRWQEVGFCDLHEFDALFQKAQSLAAEGLTALAALFYEMALALVQGPLFEDLPGEFEEERQTYRRRVRHAQDFLRAHLVTGPRLTARDGTA